jgi:hypothetical protein
MNMKRGLVLSLCAAAVAAMAGPAFAVVNVQLNLRYTNPNLPAGGGSWDLLVQSTGAQGLAGISAKIGGNLGVTGIDLPANIITPNAAVFTAANSVFKFRTVDGKTEIVTGDDLNGVKVLNVGKGTGTPGNVAADDLFPVNSTFWDNSSLLASGTWTGTRPTLVAADILVNEFDGAGVSVAGTVGTVSVRGDSVGVDGLRFGDLNRNGSVAFLSDIQPALASIGTGAGKTWGQGDFSGNGTVSFLADIQPALANVGLPASPAPAIAAVPEPATVTLCAMAAFGIMASARRKS